MQKKKKTKAISYTKKKKVKKLDCRTKKQLRSITKNESLGMKVQWTELSFQDLKRDLQSNNTRMLKAVY